MQIGGFQKLSLIDYPGKLSSIVFTIGCNLRCPFCYVPQLVLPERIAKLKQIPENHIFSYLDKNRTFLDAVVITGGEPTVHDDLPEFAQKIKSKGFLIGLETNGCNALALQRLIDKQLVDYVAMDIKTVLNFEKYNKIVGGVLTTEMFENIKKSVKVLLNSKIDYELRTTLVKDFHSKEDLIEICRSIKGAKRYIIKNLKTVSPLVGDRPLHPFEEKKIEEVVSEGKKFVNIEYRK